MFEVKSMTIPFTTTSARRRLTASVATLAAGITLAGSTATVPVASAVGPAPFKADLIDLADEIEMSGHVEASGPVARRTDLPSTRLRFDGVDPMPSVNKRGQQSLLVKFVSSADGVVRAAAAGDEDLGKTKTHVDVVKIDRDENLDTKLAQYRARADVLYAEPNYSAFATVLTPPDDPSYNSQWALTKTQAVGGWSLFPGSYGFGGSATIGIIDSGVDLAHPDLVSQLDAADAANCVDADESGVCTAGAALDDTGHGTHTTGIAAAAANNGFGVAGTAFSSRVIPVKVLSALGGSYAAVTNGILWAAQHGARVISLSLGGYFYSKTLCDAVEIATESYRALVVASAGNESSSEALFPAGCPGAVGVAATNASDRAASWSNFGSSVVVSAPGVSIYSTFPPSSFATLSGTSMAAPAVAGLAALLFGQDPSRTPDDVKVILARSADKVGEVRYSTDRFALCAGCTRHPRYGYGRINVRRALGGPDFTLSVLPASRKVRRGATASYTLRVDGSGGFAAAVALTVSRLPRGSRASFGPNPATRVSTLRIRLPNGARLGTYPLAVSATGDGLTRSANLSLRVARYSGH
jgi:thermitase